MPSSGLLFHSICPSTIFRPSESKHFNLYSSSRRKSQSNSTKCRSSISTSIDYDPYELLGIDISSDQCQIKKAYRRLQKRCHPDIAGPVGHDMAIVLNEAYSLLSDPNSRYIYDQEQAKMAEFRGYTGKPVYSAWFGSETEDRAVFVDEVKCVGCLKCALFAQNTFAIESVYGRARVVGQWADPEHKIHDAIQACPVDCISVVERSKLAALEFLMSKQPRGNVRMSAGNTVGMRVSNIFVDVRKFQTRFNEMRDKASKRDSKQSDPQREARISAMQAIRSFSNWWYWQTPTGAASTSKTHHNLIPIAEKSTHPDIERLREVAAKRRAKENATPTSQNPLNYRYRDEYWTPTLILPSPSQRSGFRNSNSPPTSPQKATEDTKSNVVISKEWKNPMISMIPMEMGMISAVLAGIEGGNKTGAGLKDHIGGLMALEIVNSSWLQVLLAGITWYLIGAAVIGMVQVLGSASISGKDTSER